MVLRWVGFDDVVRFELVVYLVGECVVVDVVDVDL